MKTGKFTFFSSGNWLPSGLAALEAWVMFRLVRPGSYRHVLWPLVTPFVRMRKNSIRITFSGLDQLQLNHPSTWRRSRFRRFSTTFYIFKGNCETQVALFLVYLSRSANNDNGLGLGNNWSNSQFMCWFKRVCTEFVRSTAISMMCHIYL